MPCRRLPRRGRRCRGAWRRAGLALDAPSEDRVGRLLRVGAREPTTLRNVERRRASRASVAVARPCARSGCPRGADGSPPSTGGSQPTSPTSHRDGHRRRCRPGEPTGARPPCRPRARDRARAEAQGARSFKAGSSVPGMSSSSSERTVGSDRRLGHDRNPRLRPRPRGLRAGRPPRHPAPRPRATWNLPRQIRRSRSSGRQARSRPGAPPHRAHRAGRPTSPRGGRPSPLQG